MMGGKAVLFGIAVMLAMPVSPVMAQGTCSTHADCATMVAANCGHSSCDAGAVGILEWYCASDGKCFDCEYCVNEVNDAIDGTCPSNCDRVFTGTPSPTTSVPTTSAPTFAPSSSPTNPDFKYDDSSTDPSLFRGVDVPDGGTSTADRVEMYLTRKVVTVADSSRICVGSSEFCVDDER
jgi:hypothetical protein